MKIMAEYSSTRMVFHHHDAPPVSGSHSRSPFASIHSGRSKWGLVSIFLLSLLSLGGISCCL